MKIKTSYNPLLTENQELRNEIDRLRKQVDELTFRDTPSPTLIPDKNIPIYESIGDVTYRISLIDHKYLYISPQIMKLCGYSADIFYKTPYIIRKLVHPDSFPTFKKLWKEIFNDTTSGQAEVKIVKKNGEIIWVQQRYSVIKDENSNPILIEGIVTDISDKKNAEEALLRSESRFRTYIENSPTNIFIINNSNEIAFVNKAACSLLQYSSKELINKKIENILYKKKVKPLLNNKVKKTSSNGILDKELIFIRKDGKHINAISDVAQLSEDEYIAYCIDITDRKKIEKKIKQSETKFKNIFNSSPIGMYLYRINKAGNLILTDANPAVNKQTGFDHTPLIGLTIEDALPGIKNTNIPKNLIKVACEGSTWETLDLNYKDKNFQGVFDVYAFQTSPANIAIMFIEVTERKKAEKKLKESNRRYINLFNNTGTATCIFNSDEIITLCNAEFEELTGYSRSEIEGKRKIGDFFRKKDLERLSFVLKNHKKVKKTSSEFDFTIKNKNNKEKIIHVQRGILASSEERIASFIEITERKKAEDALFQSETQKRAFLNTLPHLAWLKDNNGIYIIVNESFAQSRNKSIEEIIGKTDFDIYPQRIAEKYIREDKKIIDSKKASFFHEKTNKRWHETFKAPIIDSSNKVVGVTGISLEITERKKVEDDIKAYSKKLTEQNEILRIINDELVKAKEKAEESDKLKSSFLANMSHEIRTPMNAILGFASLLKNNKFSEERKMSFIDIINSKSKQLLQIITDIIDISKIEAGQIKTFNKVFSINELFEQQEVYFNTHDTQDKKPIKFIIKKEFTDDQAWIYSDKLRIEQIITNLISNAYKFTEKGKIELGYKLHNDKEILFYVKDTGIGITCEEQKVIFDRFRQASSSFNRLYGGTGLGLSISKGLVKKLQGEIWLESEVNKGSVFFFKIPYVKGEKPKQRKINKRNVYNWKNKTILIAEDEDINYSFIETLIKPTNAVVVRAKNGSEAIDCCKKKKSIDLVLMDVKLPEVDGLTATKEIKKFRKTLPVIAQTAYAMSSDEDSCLKAGCDAYISKPIRIDAFLKLIDQYIL